MPQIKGTIITVFITVLIGVMKVFDIVYVMTNGNFNTNVIGNEFCNQLFTNFNNGAAAAIVVMLMIAVIPIMIYQVRHFRAEEASAMTDHRAATVDRPRRRKVAERKATDERGQPGQGRLVHQGRPGASSASLWMVPIARHPRHVVPHRATTRNNSGWWTVFTNPSTSAT